MHTYVYVSSHALQMHLPIIVFTHSYTIYCVFTHSHVHTQCMACFHTSIPLPCVQAFIPLSCFVLALIQAYRVFIRSYILCVHEQISGHEQIRGWVCNSNVCVSSHALQRHLSYILCVHEQIRGWVCNSNVCVNSHALQRH